MKFYDKDLKAEYGVKYILSSCSERIVFLEFSEEYMPIESAFSKEATGVDYPIRSFQSSVRNGSKIWATCTVFAIVKGSSEEYYSSIGCCLGSTVGDVLDKSYLDDMVSTVIEESEE